jgi:hypothetical protein
VSGRRGSLAALLLVAALASLPFVRGLASGHSFYFRDLSRQFFPMRAFVAEGLREGQVRWWDPYTHEGTPVATAPVAYPPDLLHALAPNEWFFSLLLALHVPLGAVASFALARGFGLGRTAAGGAALVYALGGFSLSSLSLYVHLQAVAWAPLVVLGLQRAAAGGPRGLAFGAAALAIAASTTALEIVAQAVVAAAILAMAGEGPRRASRFAAALLLGAGLAAAPLVPALTQIEGSARGAGFPVGMVVSYSIHPVSLVQTLVGDWYFDLSDPFGRFWGDRFLGGYPYLLSLYLGAPALALAAAGASLGGRAAWAWCGLGLAGVLVSLGPAVGLEHVVEAVPPLRLFRFPCKAFFAAHLAVAMLAGLGLDALQRGRRRAWTVTASLTLLLGGAFVAAPALAALRLPAARWLEQVLFPAEWSPAARAAHLASICDDAARGGLIAVALGLTAAMVLARRLAPGRATLAAAVLAGADLLRTGAGLNPMVSPDFYGPSPESVTLAREVRLGGGRLFTCEPEFSSAFQQARGRVNRGVDVWTMAAYRELLLPCFHLRFAVPTAYSLDLTGLVPTNRVLDDHALSCRALEGLLPRLRAAGVAWVLSADPLSHPELRSERVLRPARVAPLDLHAYALAAPLPRFFVASSVRPASSAAAAEAIAREPGFQAASGVAVEGIETATSGTGGRVLEVRATPGRIELLAVAERPSVVVVREAHAPGWSAEVDGVRQSVLRADGRHCAVAIPAGSSRVSLRYRPPGLGIALAASALGAVALGVLWARDRPRGKAEAAAARD